MRELLFLAGMFACAIGWVSIIWRRGDRRVYGWFAIANGFLLTSNALAGDRSSACWNAGFGAYAAGSWWRSGGGGGTKRRLKSWARKFRGVRRTAPAMGGA